MSKSKSGLIAAVALLAAGIAAAPALAKHDVRAYPGAQATDSGREHLDMGHPDDARSAPRAQRQRIPSTASRQDYTAQEYLDLGAGFDASGTYQHRYFGGPKSIH